ncbi:YhgE/Pip domain-containing protein [Paenibacillus sp. FA6]|uniref:YhgE/Pip domain-containing protein n=1 Tax=Paenibacillus sp. FA6 TaxID=3413029 RepID=UPI003F655850
MKKAILAYVKKPQTILAIVVALMAQLIFCAFWMTAYDGVLERTNHLKVAIVNEDGEFGQTIVQQLQGKLPFETITMTQEDAIHDLKQRNVHLIVTIPDNFGQSLQTPETKAKISYTLNESNSQITKGAMQSVVTTLTNELNHNAALQGTQMVLEQFNLPSEQASQTAQGILNKVEADLQSIYPVNGMNNQMIPMMLVLASFVGAMLMAMNVHQVSMTIGSEISKWQHFIARALLNVIGAVIVSLAGSSLILALGGQMESGFNSFWLFHFLTILTFMFFAQMFLLVLGMAGMLANMAMLSLQLVTSGTIVPREMLSDFYQSLGQLLPATYAVEGLMNLGFGGIDTHKDVLALLVTLLCSVGVGLVVTLIKKQKGSSESVEHIKSTEFLTN